MNGSLIVLARMLSVCSLMAYVGTATAQQDFPNKPIRIIVPYAPGISLDIMARLIGPKITERWGQQVIVDNRPGGNTIIGTEALMKSSPDGHTILLTTTTHVLNALLLATLPFDAIKDFAAVTSLATSELALVVNPSLPANDLREFIALAKTKPGQLNYGTNSAGGPTHLAGVLLGIRADIKLQDVPYKGSAAVMTDLIGGRVQLSFQPPISIAPHIKAGRLKALAISGERRWPPMPQVPTFTEAGLPGFDMKYWFGILAPVGTPKASVEKLSIELGRVMNLPDVEESLRAQGIDVFVSTPEKFAEFMKADLARYTEIVKAADIKIKN